jgi:hypothetical protein
MLANLSRPQPNVPSASPEQAAAIVAALERFMRATAPAASPTSLPADGWARAAVLEGVDREPVQDGANLWINT